MKTSTRKTVRNVALLAALVGSATSSGVAQTPAPPPAKKLEHHEPMKGMQHQQGMSMMMNMPHHVLAMAYRDNMVTFAKALRGRVAQSKTVEVDLARPAVAEMRRSFDQMRQHHQAHMATMGDSAKSAMSAAMKGMDGHLTALGEHLSALESVVGGSAPDPAKVTEHTGEIIKQCAAMSGMPMQGKPKNME